MYEELDVRETRLGQLILRRRRSPALDGAWVYEVTLDGAFLMSSAVNASERALATLPLAGRDGRADRVLIGGLGLGHTAEAALACPGVAAVTVVEALEPVVDWHRRELVPAASSLVRDARCALVADDFFARCAAPPEPGERGWDAVLVDIDHAPDSALDPAHAAFYTEAGLTSLRAHLRPAGVFALWSATEPSAAFLGTMRATFDRVGLHPVRFRNPHLGERDTNWIVTGTL